MPFDLCEHQAHMYHTYTHADKTPIHIKNRIKYSCSLEIYPKNLFWCHLIRWGGERWPLAVPGGEAPHPSHSLCWGRVRNCVPQWHGGFLHGCEFTPSHLTSVHSTEESWGLFTAVLQGTKRHNPRGKRLFTLWFSGNTESH